MGVKSPTPVTTMYFQSFMGVIYSIPSWELTYPHISPEKSILKMIFLFPRWDTLISWRVTPFISSRRPTGPGEVSAYSIGDCAELSLWCHLEATAKGDPDRYSSHLTTSQNGSPWYWHMNMPRFLQNEHICKIQQRRFGIGNIQIKQSETNFKSNQLLL